MIDVVTEAASGVELGELQQALAGLPRQRTQALPALHLVDEVFGFLEYSALEEVAKWIHMPRAELFAVATSYTEFRWSPLASDSVRVCRGMSCQIAAGESEVEGEAHECMFLCAAAADGPISVVGADRLETSVDDSVFEAARAAVPGGLRRVTSRRTADPPSWRGWAAAAELSPSEALELVQESGLLGRGGAYFPVHLKWGGAVEASSRNGRPLLVANGEEGEPGTFKDRWLMESDPQRILEGIRIACHVLGASEAYWYINGMADRSAAAAADAIAAATAAGLLDDVRVEIRRGAGGYVCGEESVILESIEGRRAVPRLKPPYPTERGLWGRPTAINSVETLANVPDIFEFGPDWFREVGAEGTPGTKLIQLSGAFRNRGVIELPLGTPVSEIVALGDPSESLAGVTMGGPSGGFLAPEHFDTQIAPGQMDGHGALLGAGGIIAIPESFGIERALAVWAEYNANESCGKCTPCREGSGRMAAALAEGNWADIEELIPLISAGSLCGLGQMAANPITSARHQFGGSVL
ncbi:MAG: NAD(P)H-dependent oxidoreductase subunit E [Chloroflexota bacterium]|nr:NAD(P)H-dependent oxidoreductase subunit E [Chloroflexota bacterium]